MKLYKTITLLTTVLCIILLNAGNVSAEIITQPAGLSPGQYRLAFVTSGRGVATSMDISFYNGFVTAAASAVPELAALNTGWSVIGSTSTVDARDNTGTNTPGGLPIYLLNGAKLVDDYDDLWDGTLDTALNQTELGVPLSPWGEQVFTGSYSTGYADPGKELGSITLVTYGYVENTDVSWARVSPYPANEQHHFYALSAPLTADLVQIVRELAAKILLLNVKNGIANSLDAKLNAVLNTIDDINTNNDAAAINSLEAFINAIYTQIGNGKIQPSEGEEVPFELAYELIDDAQAIIDYLTPSE